MTSPQPATHPVTDREFLRVMGVALLCLAASAAIMLALYLNLLVPRLHPALAPYLDSTGAEPITLPGRRFRPELVGNGGYEGNTAIITELVNEEAVLKAAQALSSGDYPFLRYRGEGLHPGIKVYLFWRTAHAPAELQVMPLHNNGDGTFYVNLSKEEQWTGTIIETSIGVFGDLRGQPFRLEEVAFLPFGRGALLRTIWGEWTAFEVWDQTSINRQDLAPKKALLKPNGVISLWALLAMLLGWAAWRLRPAVQPSHWPYPVPVVVLGCLGVAWAVISGLWLNKLVLQNAETRYLFAGKTLEERYLADWDGEYYALAQKVKAAMPLGAERNESTAGEKLIILYANNELREPYPARLRYHLQPEIRVEYSRPISEGWVKRAARDYSHILFLLDPYASATDPIALMQAERYKPSGKEQVVMRDNHGVLLALNKTESD